MSTNDLLALFAKFGTVKHLSLHFNKRRAHTTCEGGCGHVEYSSQVGVGDTFWFVATAYRCLRVGTGGGG